MYFINYSFPLNFKGFERQPHPILSMNWGYAENGACRVPHHKPSVTYSLKRPVTYPLSRSLHVFCKTKFFGHVANTSLCYIPYVTGYVTGVGQRPCYKPIVLARPTYPPQNTNFSGPRFSGGSDYVSGVCMYPPILHSLRNLNLLCLQGALQARYVRDLQAILAFLAMPICESEEYHRMLSVPCKDGGMMQCIHHSLLCEAKRKSFCWFAPHTRAQQTKRCNGLVDADLRIRARRSRSIDINRQQRFSLRIISSCPTQSHRSRPNTPSSSFSSWMWMLETPKRRTAEVLRRLREHPKSFTFWRLCAATHHRLRRLGTQRWSGILTAAAQRAFATSLPELPLHLGCHGGSPEPEL